MVRVDICLKSLKGLNRTFEREQVSTSSSYCNCVYTKEEKREEHERILWMDLSQPIRTLHTYIIWDQSSDASGRCMFGMFCLCTGLGFHSVVWFCLVEFGMVNPDLVWVSIASRTFNCEMEREGGSSYVTEKQSEVKSNNEGLRAASSPWSNVYMHKWL